MLVRFSDFVVDAKGSILGTTYQRGRYGMIRRAKPNPTNPQTTRQQERRSFFGLISSTWRLLTDSQRDGWRDLAQETQFVSIFGEAKAQSGNTLYVALNQNLLSIGASAIGPAPAAATVPSFVTFEIDPPDVSDGEILLNATFGSGASVPTGFTMVVYATPGLSAGINAPGKSKFRLIGTVAAGTALTAYDLAALYIDTFSFPVAGQRVFVRAALIQIISGLNSVPFASDAITVA